LVGDKLLYEMTDIFLQYEITRVFMPIEEFKICVVYVTCMTAMHKNILGALVLFYN